MNEAIQLILFMLALVALAPLLGKYMAKVFMGEDHIIKPVFGWLEKLVYRTTGIDSTEEMNWKSYTYSLLIFQLFWFSPFVSFAGVPGVLATKHRKLAKCIVASFI